MGVEILQHVPRFDERDPEFLLKKSEKRKRGEVSRVPPGPVFENLQEGCIRSDKISQRFIVHETNGGLGVLGGREFTPCTTPGSRRRCAT